MKTKRHKVNSTNAGPKITAKSKSKKHPHNKVSIKSGKKSSRQQSPSKLSTLDSWLQELYQSSSLKKTESGSTNEGSMRFHIRLEKVEPLQEQPSTNNLKRKKKVSTKTVKQKTNPESIAYRDRMSEYIRLGSKQYKCAKCEFTHCNLVSIRTHFDKEHNNQLFECTLCPFKTRLQYYFNSHVKQHSRPDMECPHCKKMIKWFSYKMHVKIHERNDKSEYKCTVCAYRSYNHANVKRHMLARHKNPHELKTFTCDTCKYVTIFEERLKQHKKVVHSKEGLWLTCPECEYTTRNKSHMTRHVNDLHKEKTLQCDQCSQLFSNKDNLRYHTKRMHTDLSTKKYYYCELCPKEEPYKTTEKGNLARHILAHRNLDEIEVFACHKCPYLGKSRNALKTHLINAHLPEMHTYKCKMCGYSTNTKSRYNHHVRDVHGKPTQTLQQNNNEDLNGAQNVLNEDVKQESDGSSDETEDENPCEIQRQLQLAEFWAKLENYQG